MINNFKNSRTRIFRDDAELEPLMNDENFNFKETRKLKGERIVLPVITF